jgi:two-component system OmpR family sensor kinase
VHIADTADAVASGEVERRVEVAGGYEVARLGRALNSAFDARETSERALRAFISDASHELRTPLTSIRGYTELLQAGALTDDEAKQRALERIGHEAARMGVLVDDLLVLARLDERRPLQLADLDLAAIAADAVHDAQAVEPDRPIELVAPNPVPLLGDETGIRQVFANLLTNARMHTPPATRVEVRVTASGGDARIDVVDDGAGLDVADGERVFDRFWRGANGRRGHDDGTGLGLAIVAAVATAHGGRASVEHSPDRLKGAHFVVILPVEPRV